MFSGSRTIFDFGPDGSKLLALGGGKTIGLANPVWLPIVLVVLFWFAFAWTRWGATSLRSAATVMLRI